MIKGQVLLALLGTFTIRLFSQTPVLEFAHPYSNNISNGFEDIVLSIDWYSDTLVVSGTFKEGTNIGLQSDINLFEASEVNRGVSLFYDSDYVLVDTVVLGTIIDDFKIDAEGNKYFMGEMRDPQDFDLIGLSPVLIDPLNFNYEFYSSYSSLNNLNWLRYGRFRANAFCVASEYTIGVGHYGGGNQVYGLGDTLTFLASGSPNNAFALAINNNGHIISHYLLANPFNEILSDCDYSNKLNEMALCGRLSGPADFQWEGEEEEVIEYSGMLEAILIYNQELVLTHKITIENQSNLFDGSLPKMKYDSEGNLYFGATVTSGNYAIRINENEYLFSVNDDYEFVIFKLNQNKEFQWIRKMSQSGQNGIFNDFEIDHNCFVHVCGFFDESLDFLNQSLTLTGQDESGFLARWTPEGDLVWAFTINDGGVNNIRDICITPDNEMYIGGTFSSFSTDFDFTENGSFDLGPATGEDAFLAKYTISNPTPDVFVEQGWQTTQVVEGGEGDVIYVRLSHAPTAPVQVTVMPNSQLDLGNGPGVAVTLNFAADATAVSQQAITVSAFDDITVENLHSGLISFSITSSDTEFNGLTENSISVSITDNDIVGINELDNTLFTISPNPATNELLVSFTSNQSNTWMQIYDETGKLVMTEQVTAPQHRLDISTLATGTYTIAIQSQNQKQTKVFVKQ